MKSHLVAAERGAAQQQLEEADRQQLEPGEAERQQLEVEGQLGAMERQFVQVQLGQEERQLLEVEVEQGAAERQLVQIQLLGAAERHFLQN